MACLCIAHPFGELVAPIPVVQSIREGRFLCPDQTYATPFCEDCQRLSQKLANIAINRNRILDDDADYCGRVGTGLAFPCQT